MFDHIWKQLFQTLIRKTKCQRKFEDVHEKQEFCFFSGKMSPKAIELVNVYIR